MDIVKLKDFYRGDLGRTLAKVLTCYIEKLLKIDDTSVVLGLGYTVPFITNIRTKGRFLALATTSLDAQTKDGQIIFAKNKKLPFLDNTFDKVILIHELEYSENPNSLLEEVSRILRVNGKIIIAVPNKYGLWASSKSTPVAESKAFSSSDLSAVLKRNNFSISQSQYGVFIPPTSKKWLQKLVYSLEKAGYRWFAPFSGFIIVEAKKTIYSGSYADSTIELIKNAKRATVATFEYRSEK